MAEIQPLRAWRYNSKFSANIEDYISPLFDVVSDQQLEILYNNPYNSIHLSVPKGPNAAENAALTLQKWKEEGVIQQDLLPSIYVYYQYFNLPGSVINYCRKGFICNIRAYDWQEKVVLRHENTMPPAVQDRLDILKSTQLNASATHGLYSDPDFELEALLDDCMRDPIMEAEDYQGVKEVISVIHDKRAIQKIVDKLKDQQIILADGHHRYQGAIDYRQYCTLQNPHHTGKEGYNYHMMFFTNMEAKDLRILATHRLIQGLSGFSQESFMQELKKYFQVTEVGNPLEINEVILGKKHTFGVVLPEHTYKISLKKNLEDRINWPFPDLINDLDLTILHYYVIEKALGIVGKDQRLSEAIIFDRNFTDCIERVRQGESQVALITNELSMDTVKQVCFSGYTLPQKSTYFYPKVVCGFVFGTIKEDEYHNPYYPSF